MGAACRIANCFLLFSSFSFVCLAFGFAFIAQDTNACLIVILLLGACQMALAFANFFKSYAVKSWSSIQASVCVITLTLVAMTTVLYFNLDEFIIQAGQNYSTDLRQQAEFSASIKNNADIIVDCTIGNCFIQVMSASIVLFFQLRRPRVSAEPLLTKKLTRESTDYESLPSLGTTPKAGTVDSIENIA